AAAPVIYWLRCRTCRPWQAPVSFSGLLHHRPAGCLRWLPAFSAHWKGCRPVPAAGALLFAAPALRRAALRLLSQRAPGPATPGWCGGQGPIIVVWFFAYL